MKSLCSFVLLAGLLSACAAKQDVTVSPRGCTEEAKVCDDGSTVARSGPSCEFEACPGDAMREPEPEPEPESEADTAPPAGYPCSEDGPCPDIECDGDDCPSI